MTTTRTLTKPEAGTWALDPSHTRIGFVARHLMTAKVRGTFEGFSGTIDVAEDLTQSTVDVTIDTTSVNTNSEDRDNHLRSGDFFDAEAHPTMRFRSTEINQLDDGRFEVAGDLTIRDITKPVTLDTTYLGLINDPWGNAKVLLEASAKINREDWGLTWNAALETGGLLVSKEITIELEVQAAKA
ncbi:MAG TPA: YceI family protein [Acidimicrobiia bacterium]|nr:YceI family protein [Acidimicrobiia bacterium]